MQQRVATVKRKPKKQEYIKGKGWRARRLKSGDWQWEIRSKKYPYDHDTIDAKYDANDVERIMKTKLEGMADANTPGMETKVLHNHYHDDLIDAYLKVATISERRKDSIRQFQRDNKTALKKIKLSQHNIIEKLIEDYITKRKKEVDVEFTITTQLQPLRTMYRDAGKERLYGLIDYKVKFTSPFSEIKLPKDEWEEKEIGQVLTPSQELKLYEAIERECKDPIERLKWITLVQLALITCLREGVLLRLKWSDVDWENKWITVSKAYWKGGKRAPPYVPITDKLHKILERYYLNLSDVDKKPNNLMFVGVTVRKDRANDGHIEEQKGGTSNKFRIMTISADIWIPVKTARDEVVHDENGEIKRRYFRFHDLKHTANSRYDDDPYNLHPKEYGYLTGHRKAEDKTKMQWRYTHKDEQRFCNKIRMLINEGDDILANKRFKPGGTVPEPYEIAFDRYIYDAFMQYAAANKASVMRDFMQSWTEKFGAEQANINKEGFERELEQHLANPRPFPLEDWKYEMAKSIDYNRPREEYKEEYGFYPEDDEVMQAWRMSGGKVPLDKRMESRAREYMRYINERAEEKRPDYKEYRKAHQLLKRRYAEAQRLIDSATTPETVAIAEKAVEEFKNYRDDSLESSYLEE